MLTTGAPAAIASINDTGMPSPSPPGAIWLGSVKIVALDERLAHLHLRARAEQLHLRREPLPIDAGLECAAKRPVADDLAAEAAPSSLELADGVEEHVESLDGSSRPTVTMRSSWRPSLRKGRLVNRRRNG